MGDQVELVNILETEDFQSVDNIKTNVWNQKLANIHKAVRNRDKFLLIFIVVQVICISLTVAYLNGNRGFEAPTKIKKVYRDGAGSSLKTGPLGTKCNAGDKGEKGERGDFGLRGLSGVSGDKGEIGDKGSSGAKGQTGDKGPLGEKGPTGMKGQNGEQGLKGERGPIRDKGQVGDKGQDGDKGVNGTNGPDGDKREFGAKGRGGDKGYRGEKGSIGKVGPTGNKGLPSEKELTGAKGPQGETGLPGLKGARVEDGEKGSPGESVQKKLCGPGWEQSKQSCYYIEIRPTKTWNEAKMDCRIKGSRLVKIDNAFENSFLKLFAKDRNARHVWIGAHDSMRESHFVWEADNTDVTFTDWASRQPDNYRNGEDCVHLDYGLSNTWNDNSCSKRLGYICEKQ